MHRFEASGAGGNYNTEEAPARRRTQTQESGALRMNNEPKFCGDCAELGISDVKAHRVIGKRGVCEEHYRQRMGLPQRTPEAESIVERWKTLPEHKALPVQAETEKSGMARHSLHGINWNDVQADRNAGELSIMDIAKKYNCSSAQVFAKTRPRKAAADPAVKDAQQNFAKKRRGTNDGAGGSIESVMNVLRNRKLRLVGEITKIDLAISTLEALDGSL
jgi:hypothetical protein